ncbi:MAG: amidohydrolase family protein [Brevinematales bacterium]|nr:amidohydrolase family protein [Brevinematales bacterium]
MRYAIEGGTIVTPDDILRNKKIIVNNDVIEDITENTAGVDYTLKMDDASLIFPGLINAHDHLLGTYYPRIGFGPYLNWLPWDNDLKECPLYEERSAISNFDLYLLGVYRNIVSGVTTVSDHIPHSVNAPFIDKLPMRVLWDYGMQHECVSFDLRWGGSMSDEHKYAVDNDLPFLTHIEEGYDEEATLGIEILQEMKVLDDHSVLVHGISLSKQDITAIAKAKANVVWCPTSNYFMFKDTTNIRELLKQNVNVSLGTDSPMSGGMNLLEEMQFAVSLYWQLYQEKLDYKTLVQMVTTRPAKAFRLKKLGKIEAGYTADFTILKNGNSSDPYESLIHSWLENIRLVISGGVPLYGLAGDKDFFGKFEKEYQILKISGEDRLLIGQPENLYERIWENVKFKKVLPFLPVDIYE